MTIAIEEPHFGNEEHGKNIHNTNEFDLELDLGEFELEGGFAVPEANAFGQTFRDYNAESERKDSVEEFYKNQHINQSFDFVKKMREEYGKLDRTEMSIWECCELLNEFVDESDPDLDEPQIEHLLQTAEAIRKDYPNEDWLHLTGLIHDLGKVLLHPKFGALPQWAVVGDTFPVGCAFDESNIHRKYFEENPDSKNPNYQTKNGVYSPGCGLNNVMMSWGHDDYMYLVAKENKTTLPSAGLFIIRYHSFYPLHRSGAYTHLMNEEDVENLKWLQIFNKYDLYSKSKVRVDVEKVKPYYLSLIEKGILVTATGWTNAAAIDIVYDVLHMMGRDDIPVGRGEVFAMGQPNPSFSAVGDCKYIKAIPHGSGGQLDSDTLYGFARNLPKSPRRYTAENSVQFGAPRDTDHPELRQPLALEIWQSIAKSLSNGSKVSVLTNGPLSNLAQIILSDKNASSVIENVYVVGGNIKYDNRDTGNVFTVPVNKYSELNMYLDPLAAKTVFESGLNITLIPLSTQQQVTSFSQMIESLRFKRNTPESIFSRHLLSLLSNLQKKLHRYHHMDIFLGEILGAVIVGGDKHIDIKSRVERVTVSATGDISTDGRILIDEKNGSFVNIIESVDPTAHYQHFAELLGSKEQSAKIASFSEQKRIWTKKH